MCLHICYSLSIIVVIFVMMCTLPLIYYAVKKEVNIQFDKEEHCKCAPPSKIPVIGASDPISDSDLQWIVLVPLLDKSG